MDPFRKSEALALVKRIRNALDNVEDDIDQQEDVKDAILWLYDVDMYSDRLMYFLKHEPKQ